MQKITLLCLATPLLLPKIYGASSLPYWDPICKEGKKPVQPEECLFSNALINYWGYPAETYVVPTGDGYKLTLFRIPHGKNEERDFAPKPKPVVFLQHGLMDSSDCWIINLPNESLAFVLADAGYDVWLGNEKDFWAFTWEQHAEIDLPAMVEFALSKCGASQLDYVGHSQGTLMGFVKFGTYPEWAKQHIRGFYTLAPIWFLGHITNPLRGLINSWTITALEDLFYGLHVYDFGTSEALPTKLAELFCIADLGMLYKLHHQKISFFPYDIRSSVCSRFDQAICKNVIDWIEGFDKADTNNTRLPTILAHQGSGTSVMNIAHYGQMVASNQVRKFDYGKKDNPKHYNGQSTPPQYHVTSLATPTLIFHGGKDVLSDPTGIDTQIRSAVCETSDDAALFPLIGNVIRGIYYFPTFNHIDPVYGLDSFKVNQEVLNHLATT